MRDRERWQLYHVLVVKLQKHLALGQRLVCIIEVVALPADCTVSPPNQLWVLLKRPFC